MTGKRGARPPPPRSNTRPKRTPALKAHLKSKAKVSSGRATARATKPTRLAAMLDAVRGDPDDDELRLVLADALEEAGALEHAQLVRLQTAIARGGTDAATIRRAKGLQAERDNVLAAHAVSWQSDRGLVWHVEARTDEWIAHGGTLFEAEPITSIGLLDPADEDDDFDASALIAKLAAQRWLEYVNAIEIPQWDHGLKKIPTVGDPDVVIELLGSAHLQRLTKLTFGHPRSAIAAVKHCELPKLRALGVHHDDVLEGDEIIETLLGRTLTELELVGCRGTTAEGTRMIANAGWRLDRLVITRGELEEPGMRALAEAPSLAALRELRLDDNLLDDASMRTLAGSPHLRSLRTLSLANNFAITDDGLVMLAESPVIESVRQINVTGTSVTARGIATLPAHLVVQT